jgi:hypothetical protein
LAAWRRRALATFPELRVEIQRPEFTIYSLFFELLPMVRSAHERDDGETLRRIYGFAEWCFSQKAKDLWNAAGVAFYEHLFDEKAYRDDILSWLSPHVINGCWGLWEARLTRSHFEELRESLAKNRKRLKCLFDVKTEMGFVILIGSAIFAALAGCA